jgi:molybdopterin converting factor small subunit
MPGLLSLDRIVKNLETHDNSTRIKKLMVYTCQSQWENELSILNQYEFSDLIQQLRASHFSLEQLRSTLYSFAETLNRQAEYLVVADTIIHQLEPLYSEPEELTQVVAVKSPHKAATQPPWIVLETASELAENSNILRIKKLMLYVSQNHWETNSQILEQLNLADLIQDLRESYPSIKKLSAALKQQVQTLNRQADYIVVAKTILKVLQKLYTDDSEITRVKAAKAVRSQPPAPPPTRLPSPINRGNKNTQQRGDKNKQSEFIHQQSSGVKGQENGQNLTQDSTSKPCPYDPFDLRLNVMKYTTPLRAKLLIFSVLYHPIKKTQHDWLLMKAKPLDDLLFELFSTCPTLEELEAKLYQTAQAIEDADENIQAAGAIAQSMKRFYER